VTEFCTIFKAEKSGIKLFPTAVVFLFM